MLLLVEPNRYEVSYRSSTLLRVGLGQVRTGNVQRDGPFDAWAQEDSSKPDPKGGDESPWKLQESLVHDSQHAAQQHRRQQDRSDPPGESISGAMSAVKQKETGDPREAATAIDGPHRFPAISVVAATVAAIAPMHPRVGTAARRWVPTPSETRPKLVTVTAKKSGATSNNRKG
jgi:hypothetical protein